MSSRTIKTWRDPYGEGFSTCRLKEIELFSGLTVLVGCNGAGKSTLLKNIEDVLEDEEIPCVMFDNLSQGSSHSMSAFGFDENFAMLSTLATSSEGECIGINIGYWLKGIHNFLQTGEFKSGHRGDDLANIFRRFTEEDAKKDDARKQRLEACRERWLLLDAADSGYSIDNIMVLKEVFKLIFEDGEKMDKDIYIVISANEYELASGEACFDVNSGKYITFDDYNAFKKFIIESSIKKDKRYKKLRKKKEDG